MPKLRPLVRHALPNIVEASIIPLVLFYGALKLLGVTGSLAVALGWSYLAVGRRVVTGQRVPGLLLLGTVGLTARTAVALATGSVFVYFLQPTLTTIVVAGVFLASLATRRPLAERLAADFCPLPPGMLAHPPVRRFFVRITILWALVQLTNAGATIWLLMTQSVGAYMLSKAAVSWGLTIIGITVSTVHFKRSMRRHGILARA